MKVRERLARRLRSVSLSALLPILIVVLLGSIAVLAYTNTADIGITATGALTVAPTADVDGVTSTGRDNSTVRGVITHDGNNVCDAQIRWRIEGDPAWTEEPWDVTGYRTGDTFSVLLTPLNPDTIYETQVRARNEAGDGAWSVSVLFSPSSIPPNLYRLASILPYAFVGVALLVLVGGIAAGYGLVVIFLSLLIALVGVIGVRVIQDVLSTL